MSTFKCPSCHAELPDFQQSAGFCPYCDAKWGKEGADAQQSGGDSPADADNSSTLNAGDHDWDDDETPTIEPSGNIDSGNADSGNATEKASAGQTLQLDDSEETPQEDVNQTIDLPDAADVGSEFMGAKHEQVDQTIQFGEDDTSATVVPDKLPQGGDPSQTLDLDHGPPSGVDTNQTIDLPPSGSPDSMQTLDLDDMPPAGNNRNSQTLAFQVTDDNQQTIDIHDANGPESEDDLMVTFGSKPLSPSAVKKFWGTGEGSPMQTMRTATVSKAKELGVDLRRRVLSDQEEGSDYAIINQLGKGGMGVVYAAKQKSLRRRVAVKTLKRDIGQRDDDRAKFLSEAVITGVLDHPNIVPIHELGQTEDGTLFYSMKCVTGTEWHKVIRSKSEAENLEIFMKVADAVAFAHSKNVIHRDLKPENVMLGEYGEVLVMDWGLAVDLNRKEEFTMGGTPAYMSPEMAKGPLDRIGKCSDIYLLGAMLYEIVTGFPPHAASSITECLVAAAQNVIVRSESTSRLKNIALKAMATSPKLRFNSVALLQEEVRKYQSTAQSIELTNTAQQELKTAKETENYELFSRAMFGFEDALKLWSENDAADRGIKEARQEYAKCALKKADYDLGLQLVSPADPDEAPIYQELTAAKANAERTSRNAKMARYVAVGSLLFALVGAGIGLFIINGLYQKAEEAADIAIAAEQEATKQRDDAQQARQKAEDLAEDLATERDALKVAYSDLDKANSELTNANSTLEMNASTIRKQNSELEKQRDSLKTALVTVERERNRAKFAGMFASVGLAQSKVESNDISSALNLLEGVPTEFRGWEWKHLAYLCHPDIPHIPLKHIGSAVAISPDGKWTAIGTQNGGVDVYPTDNATAPGTQPNHLNLPDARITALQFSNDGKQLWIGTDNTQKLLQVWNMQGEPRPIPLNGLNEFSTFPEVSAIQFTPGSNPEALLAVGGRCYRMNASTFAGRPTINVANVYDLAISPDGQQYAHSQEWQGEYRVKRLSVVDGNKELAELQLSDRATHCEYVANDLVAIASADGSLNLWGGPENRYETVFTMPAQINDMQFDASRNLLSVALADSSLKLFQFNPATRRLSEAKTLRGHQASVLGCALHPGKPLLVSASEDETARFWDYQSYQDQREVDLPNSVLWAGFSDDGNRFVTGDQSGRAQIWNSKATSAKPLVELVIGDWTGQNIAQRSASTPLGDGKHVLSADSDVGLAVWDIASQRIVWQRKTLSQSYQVAAIPQTDHFVYVDVERDENENETTILRGATATGQSLFEVETLVEAKQVLDLVVAPSGKLLAVRSPNGIRIYPMPQKGDKELAKEIWSSDAGPVLQMEFRSDDVILLGYHPGQENPRLSVVNFKTGQVVHDFPKEAGGLRYLHFTVSPDRNHVALAFTNYSGTQNDAPQAISGHLSLYNLDQPGQPIGSVTCSGVAAYPAISADNQAVYFVQQHSLGDRDIGQWKVGQNKTEILTFSRKGIDTAGTGSREVSQVDFIPGKPNDILVSFSNRDMEEWDLAKQKSLARMAPSRAVVFCDFYQNDQQVVTAHVDGLVRLWDAASGTLLHQFDADYQAVEAAALSGDLLAVGGSAGKIDIIDLGQKVVTRSLPIDGASIDALAWAAQVDKPILMVATSQITPDADNGEHRVGQLQLISATDWTPLGQPFAQHPGRYHSLTVSQKGDRFAATSSDKGVRLWTDAQVTDLAATEPKILSGHSTDVTGAAFSANGDRLVTGSFDGSLTVWFVDRPVRPEAGMEAGAAPEQGELHIQQFVPLKGHRKEISSIAFSPDSSMLLTSSLDRSAILWFTTDLPGNLAIDAEWESPTKREVVSSMQPEVTR